MGASYSSMQRLVKKGLTDVLASTVSNTDSALSSLASTPSATSSSSSSNNSNPDSGSGSSSGSGTGSNSNSGSGSGSGSGSSSGNSANDSSSNADNAPAPASTSTKTVLSTEAPTFTGAVAGFATQTAESGAAAGNSGSNSGTGTGASAVSGSSNQGSGNNNGLGSNQGAEPAPVATGPATGAQSIGPPAESTGTPALVFASKSPTKAGGISTAATGGTQTHTSTHAASTLTSASDSHDSGSNGISSGAKAGIAIGVLGGIFLIALAIYLVVAHRKKRDGDDDDYEKMTGPSSEARDALSPMPTAPRLSLRPVTQFLPNLNPAFRSSRGAEAALGRTPVTPGLSVQPTLPDVSAPPAAAAAAKSPWERAMGDTRSHANENPFGSGAQPANPFGSGASRLKTPPDDSNAVFGREPVSPLSSNGSMTDLALPVDSSGGATQASNTPLTSAGTSPKSGGRAMAAATAATAGAALSRGASARRTGTDSIDLTRKAEQPRSGMSPSPVGTEFSVNSVSSGHSPEPSSSAAAIAAAGGPSGSTVHRVQLDFKPTLEDEMELRAGQLVRLLHEYDDGWALCIRLDRSQQGVVPRTCLSTRPVKPRPGPGHGERNGPPVSMRGPPGPQFPPGQRPLTPQGGPPSRPGSANGNHSRPSTAPGPNGDPNQGGWAQRSQTTGQLQSGFRPGRFARHAY